MCEDEGTTVGDGTANSVGCVSGSGGGTVNDKVGEGDEKDAKERSPQERGRRETGRNERECLWKNR